MNSEQRGMFCDIIIPRLVNFTHLCTFILQQIYDFNKTELVYLYIGAGHYECGLLSDLPDDAEIVAIVDPKESFSRATLLDIHRQIEMAIDSMGEALLVPTSNRLPSLVVSNDNDMSDWEV